MASLSEKIIYAKILENETPYWVLFMFNGVIREKNPCDFYEPIGDDKEENIQNAIRKLSNALDGYRENLEPGEKAGFYITMKKSKTSNGETAVFAYTFYIQKEQESINGIEKQQSVQQGLSGFRTPEELNNFIERKLELAQKEMLLGIREADLQRREKELQEKDAELNKESTVVTRGMKNAFWQIAEATGLTDKTTNTPLAGTQTKQEDPKVEKVEKIANYLYENIEENDIELLTPELIQAVINAAKNKQTT